MPGFFDFWKALQFWERPFTLGIFSCVWKNALLLGKIEPVRKDTCLWNNVFFWEKFRLRPRLCIMFLAINSAAGAVLLPV